MKHYSDYGSLAGVVGTLQSGKQVRTDVQGSEGVPWQGRQVYLVGGDEYCDSCRELIHPDDWFGDGWPNVLANMKQKHGGTWCGSCFQERDQQQPEVDDEPASPGRQFG